MSTADAYVSRVEAARLLGLSEHGLDGLITPGRLLVARPGVRNRRSLLLADVERLVEQRRVQAEERREAEAVRRRRAVERRDPPDGEWISAREAAAMLGCSRVWVHRLAGADRLPHVVRGGRFRFRRDLLRLVANAREAQRDRLGTSDAAAA